MVQVSSTYTREKIKRSLEKSKAYKGDHFYFVAISNDRHSYNFAEDEKYGLIFDPEKNILTPERLQTIIVSDCEIESQQALATLVERYISGQEKRKLLKPLGSRSTQTGFEFNYEINDQPAVPFVGRKVELRTLLDFVRGDDATPFRWWAITAPGGAGKSRLAYELQKVLQQEGDWDVRALSSSILRSENDLIELASAYPGRTLFIVDYVQQYTQQLRSWFLTLTDPDGERAVPLRILLLERDVRDADGNYPWLELLFEADFRIHNAFFAEDGYPMELRSLTPETEGTADPLLKVIRSFADNVYVQGNLMGDASLTRLPKGYESLLRSKLDQLDPQLVRPLFAMILADAWVHDATAMRWNQDQLLKVTVDREQNYIAKRFEHYGGADNAKLPKAGLQLLAIATVLGTGDGTLPLSELAKLKCGKTITLFAELNKKMLAGKGEDLMEALLTEVGLWKEGELVPLRPELLGEFFVLERMKKLSPQEATDYFDVFLSNLNATTIFFLRILRDYEKLVLTKSDDPKNCVYADWLFPLGMKLRDERKSQLVRLLYILFNGAPVVENPLGRKYITYIGANTLAKKNYLLNRMSMYVSTMADKKSFNFGAACNDLALALQSMGDYKKALEYYKKSLAISEKILGPDNLDTAASYNNLAGMYCGMSDYPNAMLLYQKALTIYIKAFGAEHLNTSAVCSNLAWVYFSIGDYPKAVENYQKSLAIREKLLGPEHPDIMSIYNNLATVYKAMGDYSTALEIFLKTMAIYEKVFGTEHTSTAVIYYNVAVVYQTMCDYPDALEYYQKALAIREKVLGLKHPDTAVVCHNIGSLYLLQQEPENALPWLRRAFEVFQNVFGPEHINTINAQNALAYAQKLGDQE